MNIRTTRGAGARARRTVLLAAVFAAAAATPARAHQGDEVSSIDIRELAGHADFVFKGTVTNIAYRDSEANPQLDENGQPVLDDAGNAVAEDGSNLAHTFVTFAIERIYKGHSDAAEVTLRFIGGVQEDLVLETHPSGQQVLIEQVFLVGEEPLFDLGDRDILFVERSGQKPCPLVDSANGLFRLVNRDPATLPSRQVYSDLGREILLVPVASPSDLPSARHGRPQPLMEVLTATIGGASVEEVDPPILPWPTTWASRTGSTEERTANTARTS